MSMTTITEALNHTFDKHVGGIIFSFLSHPTADLIQAELEKLRIVRQTRSEIGDYENCDCCNKPWGDCQCWCSHCHREYKDCFGTCWEEGALIEVSVE